MKSAQVMEMILNKSMTPDTLYILVVVPDNDFAMKEREDHLTPYAYEFQQIKMVVIQFIGCLKLQLRDESTYRTLTSPSTCLNI